jgi:2-methylcitrate dehydratase
MARTPSVDSMSALLAEYVTSFPRRLGTTDEDAATRVIVDSLAVAIGGLDSPAAAAARRYARNLGPAGACRIWGTAWQTTPEIASLVNGVPLRAYDYNDLYVGKADAGHPSDIVPALFAAAEHKGASGSQLLAALALGYDVTIALLESCSVGPRWDYPNLVAIGATCAIAKLLCLNEAQTAEALGITVVSHAASGEIESGDLNHAGNLTMWKRFNGADAMRQAVYACLLAEAGVEGPVKPFVGKYGFLNLLCEQDDVLTSVSRHLSTTFSRVGASTFKRWPVGSRAQSAIQAALQARAGVADIAAIREIRVRTNPATFHHLVAVRDKPWAPISRETADHSLPYIVGTAVFDGKIDVQSFDPAAVMNAERRAFIQSCVRVEDTLPVLAGDTAYPTYIRIETLDGGTSEGSAAPPPGHPLNPLDTRALEQKFVDCSASFAGNGRIPELLRALWSMRDTDDIRDLTTMMASAVANADPESSEATAHGAR